MTRRPTALGRRVLAGLVAAAALALPAASQPAGADPQAYLAKAIEILKTRHMNTAQVDWPAVETRARDMAGKAATPAETYPAILYVIQQLKERHSYLLPADQARRQTSGRDPNGAPAAFETPTGVRLQGRIGQVTVPAFSGSMAQARAYAAAGRKAVETLDRAGVCGWLIDLRGNGGGNMWPMLNSLAGLLGEPPYGAFVGPHDERSTWTLRDGEVVNGRAAAILQAGPKPTLAAAKAPVAVLVGPRTSSSGEFTAMGLAGRPRTRIFGLPSAGFVTANTTYPLPDGALLAVSSGWGEDRTGRRYTDRITPDAPAPDSQAAVDMAMSWLASENCR